MRSSLAVVLSLLAMALCSGSCGPTPRSKGIPPDATILVEGEGSLPSPPDLADFEIGLEFRLVEGADGGVVIGDLCEVVLSEDGCGGLRGVAMPIAEAALPAGEWQALEVRFRQDRDRPGVVSAWLNGTQVLEDVVVPGPVAAPGLEGLRKEWAAADTPDLSDGRFSIVARFRSRGDGTLVGKAPPGSTKWAPQGKTLFLRGGRLVYDIGWVGAMSSRARFDDGEEHTAVLTHEGRKALLFVDGELQAEREDFTSADAEGHVLKIGATSTNFGGGLERGEIEQALVLDAPLGRDAALEASRGAPPQATPAVRWVRPEDPPARDGDGVPRRVHLRAGTPPVRFRDVWTRPLGDVDHAKLIARWDEESLARGAAIYRSVCQACHGADGETVTLPTARPFSKAALENGAAPHRIFTTLTHGFRTMPPQTWMTAEQRYDVVHFLREEFLRERNPSQYVPVDADYLASLPRAKPRYPDQLRTDGGLAFRDFGPGLVAQVGSTVPAGLAARLPHDVTIAYDLHRMASVGAWRGAFLDLSETQHHLQRGEGIARPGATPWEWTTHWSPIADESDKPPRGPVPSIRRIGYHVHGHEIVLRYAIRGREVLESPTAVAVGEQVALVHRMRIAAGDVPVSWRWAEPTVERDENGDEHESGGFPGRDEVTRIGRPDGTFVAAAVRGDLGGSVPPARRSEETVHWSVAELVVPPSDRDLVFTVIRAAAGSEAELAAFEAWISRNGDDLVEDPADLTGGGPALWPDVLTTTGELGRSDGAYAVDTLTLPDVAPMGSWLRTSALDFFSDGRAAVCTLGGDVWIVDGIDDGLRELRWKRFAAGLFEPLGLLVVDDVVHVTCRDGLIRLHDRDGNGEADFHECIYADVDVTPSFHAFNFDLQRTPDGRLCYVKSGRYTQFTLPGAVVSVDPADGSARYVATGFRTPNGMGLLPDGSLTVSDNQGNWVPASKISRIREGGFYGVFQTDRQEREDFDRPFLWLPQDVDSSSGGQLWLDDERFGPLAGRLLHTSFGKGQAYALTLQEIDGVLQASSVTLPFQFAAGVQRARTNPVDGQVYLVGLSGWQGPPDGADGCLQRLRWTGRPKTFLIGATVVEGGVELEFTGALEPDAANAERFEVEAWNYRWAARYGSAQWSVREPDREGHDALRVAAASLGPERRRIRLELPGLVPCDQVRIRCRVPAAGSGETEGTVHLTVRRLR